ncbi:hypothetical protein [Candidatus Finniella inopinata]|uniref:Uncharacterized protein n=1 Tax=Candidatus Finniella inopinata TaxID=1696036 RepID=A0A4Q7DM48_9PROT|nr:hypothetical protein [Candidatus Finniella inopinata]RZI45856.1 hypothetical protein EQU50_05330 [Candidatus Finniella inopinata]
MLRILMLGVFLSLCLGGCYSPSPVIEPKKTLKETRERYNDEIMKEEPIPPIPKPSKEDHITPIPSTQWDQIPRSGYIVVSPKNTRPLQ